MKRKGPENSTINAFVDEKLTYKASLDAHEGVDLHGVVIADSARSGGAGGAGGVGGAGGNGGSNAPSDSGFDDFDTEAPEQEHIR